jgi:hypothetical protein
MWTYSIRPARLEGRNAKAGEASRRDYLPRVWLRDWRHRLACSAPPLDNRWLHRVLRMLRMRSELPC